MTACLLPSGGCSFLLVQPPSDAEGGHINCTTDRAPPIIDTILVGTNVGSVIYVLSQDSANKPEAVAAGLLVAGLWLGSAIYGYSNTSACAEAQSEDGPRYRPFHPSYRDRSSSWSPGYVPPAPHPAAPARDAGRASPDGGAVPASPDGGVDAKLGM